MDRATKSRQQAHRMRKANNQRKQRIKEAGEGRPIFPEHSFRRPTFNPFAGPQMSMAAAEALFPRMFR